MARVVRPGMEKYGHVPKVLEGSGGRRVVSGFQEALQPYPGLPYTPIGQGTKLSLTPKSFGGSTTALWDQARERELRALPHSSQPFFPLC